MGKIARALTGLLLLAALAGDAKAEMFGLSEVRNDDITQFTKWESVLNKFENEEARNDPYLQQFKLVVQHISMMNLTMQQKVEALNAYVNNRIKYMADSAVWGRSDYWAAPGETFAKGYGDCDDYAIAKYFGLKMLGFQPEDMRVVILRDSRKNELHAVLALNNSGSNYILDNQFEVVATDVQLSFYQPIFSINEGAWWQHS